MVVMFGVVWCVVCHGIVYVIVLCVILFVIVHVTYAYFVHNFINKLGDYA